MMRDLPWLLRRFSFSSLLSMSLITSWLLHPFPTREKLGSCDAFASDSFCDIPLAVCPATRSLLLPPYPTYP